MTETTIKTNPDDIFSPKIFVEQNSDILTDSQLGWLIKTRHKNGLAESGAILKISRKIYIHKPLFFAWFMNQKAA